MGRTTEDWLKQISILEDEVQRTLSAKEQEFRCTWSKGKPACLFASRFVQRNGFVRHTLATRISWTTGTPALTAGKSKLCAAILPM
jgi:hypothetical protein